MLVAIVMLSASWLPSLITAQVNQSCMNLQSSKACPAYQQYYVNIPANTTNYPWLASVSDVPGFDQALYQYANSTQNYLQILGCTNGPYPSYIPYARYSLSMLCEQIIQDSQDCNAVNNLYPGPLCSDTCMSYVASVAQITSNTSLCQPSDMRTSEIADLYNRCSTWDGYNGTTARGCISGSANEPLNCGKFSNMFICQVRGNGVRRWTCCNRKTVKRSLCKPTARFLFLFYEKQPVSLTFPSCGWGNITEPVPFIRLSKWHSNCLWIL